MRNAPSLLSLSADRWSRWGWGTTVSFRWSAPCRHKYQIEKIEKEESPEQNSSSSKSVRVTFIRLCLTRTKVTASSHLVGHGVQPIQVRMNHPHQLLQRLSLELTHGEDPLVQPRARSCPQGFLGNKHKVSLKPVCLLFLIQLFAYLCFFCYLMAYIFTSQLFSHLFSLFDFSNFFSLLTFKLFIY